MQFPESWLREFCNPPLDSDALAEMLTMAGMEVEESRPVAPAFHGVVVAEVLSVAVHPNADRLNVCRVDVGGAALLNIVCGAPNVRAGLKVPCALVGADLPPSGDKPGAPFQIKLSKLRGVESQGMLCSARELGLSDDHTGLLELDAQARVGEDIRRQLLLDDRLLTLKLTPNLAHCLSVYGVARELSALTGAPLSAPPRAPAPVVHNQVLPVDVQAPELCGRFSGRVIRNVDTRAATPSWMSDRLMRCGQRSVSALVDISNYVMFESGQPSHVFDLDKIGDGGLAVRWGRSGETLGLLNGTTVAVDSSVGVIADASANVVESLAGIMGGDATAVSDATRSVYVEAAFWWPDAVAGRSRRFNFSTDAGHRFERGVDAAQTVEQLERVTQLIVDVCGGEAGPIDDQRPNLPLRQPVVLRVDRAARVIGIPLTQEQCEGVMRRLGFEFSAEPGRLAVVPPSWRFDLCHEENLIEEVIRLLGYNALPAMPPVATLTSRVRAESTRGLDAIRRQLAAQDYQETINFSFVEARWEDELAGNADPIRLLNPIASHLAVLRSSLLGSLIGVLRFNLARKAGRVRVFEVGRTFMRSARALEGPTSVAGVAQPMRVAALAYGAADALQWGTPERGVDFFDMKGDIEALFTPRAVRFVSDTHPAMHPGRCARIELDGQAVGHAGELHPKWLRAYELPGAPQLFELDATALTRGVVPAYAAVQRQQSVWRDISVVAPDSVTFDTMTELFAQLQASSVLRSTHLFDLYKPSRPTADIGPGERSLSVRLELRDDDLALTDVRIDAAVAEVLVLLSQRLGVRLRE